VTKFGKLADPIADKALTGMALVCLSIIGELWWWATIVILVREWGITILRFAMLRYGVMAAGRGGKIKTFVQAIGIILYLLPLASLAACPGPRDGGDRTCRRGGDCWRPCWLTVVCGLDYVRRPSGSATGRLGPVNLSPAARVLAELRRAHETVATAESLTGGHARGRC
jgi:phosphatidylglycerophosphate synthase